MRRDNLQAFPVPSPRSDSAEIHHRTQCNMDTLALELATHCLAAPANHISVPAEYNRVSPRLQLREEHLRSTCIDACRKRSHTISKPNPERTIFQAQAGPANFGLSSDVPNTATNRPAHASGNVDFLL